MSDMLHAMLANAGDDFGKVIFGIIVFVVWGIGALVKMSKTQTAQAKKRQAQLDAAIRAQMEAARRREAAVAAQGRSAQRRPVGTPLPLGARQVQQPARQKQQKRRVQMTPPALPQLQPVLEEIPRVVESEIGSGAIPVSPTRRQAVAGPALQLSARSLRQQFILTEILQPPVSLREQPLF